MSIDDGKVVMNDDVANNDVGCDVKYHVIPKTRQL